MTQSSKVKMFYFGPWDEAGHHIRDENGFSIWLGAEEEIPWKLSELDTGLAPHNKGCFGDTHSKDRKHLGCYESPQGTALLHKKSGWTAIAFFDRSVDQRGNSNSVYLAEGDFTFAEMVEMSKTRFAHRWNKMKFEIKEVPNYEKAPHAQ